MFATHLEWEVPPTTICHACVFSISRVTGCFRRSENLYLTLKANKPRFPRSLPRPRYIEKYLKKRKSTVHQTSEYPFTGLIGAWCGDWIACLVAIFRVSSNCCGNPALKASSHDTLTGPTPDSAAGTPVAVCLSHFWRNRWTAAISKYIFHFEYTCGCIRKIPAWHSFLWWAQMRFVQHERY